jgi:hypothetical protein
LAIAAAPEHSARSLGVQNLALAPILGSATTAPATTAEAGRTEAAVLGRLQILVDADHRRHETSHRYREQKAVQRHLRTLCEDLDELLGQLGESARHHHVETVDPLLINAVAIATELARRLPCGRLRRNAPTAHVAVDVLDEVDVQRTLVLLEELDAELDRTARGDKGDRGAPALARAVLARIDALARAAASGRTRSRRLRTPPTDHANGGGCTPSTEGCPRQGEGAPAEAGAQARSGEEELLRPSGRTATRNRPVPGFELDADASLAPNGWRWRVRPRRLDGSLGQPVAVRLTLAEAERIRQRYVIAVYEPLTAPRAHPRRASAYADAPVAPAVAPAHSPEQSSPTI